LTAIRIVVVYVTLQYYMGEILKIH